MLVFEPFCSVLLLLTCQLDSVLLSATGKSTLTGSSFELFAIYRKRNVMHYDVTSLSKKLLWKIVNKPVIIKNLAVNW